MTLGRQKTKQDLTPRVLYAEASLAVNVRLFFYC
jgi:hypothetical protein